MSCANTSLPWFIEPPRAMLPGRAAKPKFEIQIETNKINRLCVFHQQLTGAENPNVGTLLILTLFSLLCRAPRLALFLSAVLSLFIRLYWSPIETAPREEHAPIAMASDPIS